MSARYEDADGHPLIRVRVYTGDHELKGVLAGYCRTCKASVEAFAVEPGTVKGDGST